MKINTEQKVRVVVVPYLNPEFGKLYSGEQGYPFNNHQLLKKKIKRSLIFQLIFYFIFIF